MTEEIITTKIAIFRKKEIRKIIHKNEWWFVIADIVVALTDYVQPEGYIKDMRRRDEELAKGWGQIATPLTIRLPISRKNALRQHGRDFSQKSKKLKDWKHNFYAKRF